MENKEKTKVIGYSDGIPFITAVNKNYLDEYYKKLKKKVNKQ